MYPEHSIYILIHMCVCVCVCVFVCKFNFKISAHIQSFSLFTRIKTVRSCYSALAQDRKWKHII